MIQTLPIPQPFPDNAFDENVNMVKKINELIAEVNRLTKDKDDWDANMKELESKIVPM